MLMHEQQWQFPESIGRNQSGFYGRSGSQGSGIKSPVTSTDPVTIQGGNHKLINIDKKSPGTHGTVPAAGDGKNQHTWPRTGLQRGLINQSCQIIGISFLTVTAHAL